MNNKPEKAYLVKLSVIVVSTCLTPTLENCLNNILDNENYVNIEIITAICTLGKSLSGLKRKFPTVRFIEFREKAGIPILSAAGINKSNGEIIAVTDSTTIVEKCWITSVIQSHQSSALIIGGAVKTLEKMNSLDLAAFFCDYGQFTPPVKRGCMDVLPGNNFSFKRSALTIGSEFVAPEFWKTFWCQKLQNADINLFFDPEIVVYNAKTYFLVPFLKKRFDDGRCFAGMRVQYITNKLRLFYIIGSLFLPFIFFYRILSTIIRKDFLLKNVLLACPFILLAILSWTMGEFWGYLAGTRRSSYSN